MSEEFENFTDAQKKILKKFVSNTDLNVFAIRNLPEVVKGALFSRYSRSSLGLRNLLLNEFIQNEDTSFTAIAGVAHELKETPSLEQQSAAIQKAQSFYNRILDGYGDDSIGELGGAHLAMENISMIAAKQIEDCRIGGSPLEKSTRYMYFDQKIDGEYLFYKEPVLMTSAYKELYLETCNLLFETYSNLIPPLTALIEKKFPKSEQISKNAYSAALRAKVLDCLRGLLPASTLTNVGLFGNGRFFEKLLQQLKANNLTEMQDLGKLAFQELSKTIPSFIRRSDTDNRYYQKFVQFMDEVKKELKEQSKERESEIEEDTNADIVRLINCDHDAIFKVAASLLFANSHKSLEKAEQYVKNLPCFEIEKIFAAASDARENRRHKSPRALERANFTFEFVADFGIYRDLQRHRTLTQERQQLSCNYGYFIPQEILKTEMEKEYCQALNNAKKAYDTMSKQLPEEAQYVVPMAYNMRWYFQINLRALQWLCELRSSPAGHPSYRYAAQEMAKQVMEKFPEFSCFFKFVDFDGYDLGRMKQEMRIADKKKLQEIIF